MKATVGLYRDAVISTTIRDGEKDIRVKPGQRLMVDLVGSAHPHFHGYTANISRSRPPWIRTCSQSPTRLT